MRQLWSALRKLVSAQPAPSGAQIRNISREAVLATRADVANTSSSRRRGLLHHERLDPGQGIWIVPCSSVHSFGMKFSIDVVYLDRKKRVRKLRHAMPPRRISFCLGAHSVIELPAGLLAETQTKTGDCLDILLT